MYHVTLDFFTSISIDDKLMATRFAKSIGGYVFTVHGDQNTIIYSPSDK